MVFELERRFILNANIDRLLNKIGGKISQTHYQHDIYFDTITCSLTQNDVWLRMRNNKWELKYGQQNIASNQRASIYNEEDDLLKIALYLSQTLKIKIDSFDQHNFKHFNKFNEWIYNVCELKKLCEFNTERKSYFLTYLQRDYKIDLDYTDFDYHVMEIETIVSTKNEIKAANDELDAFCLHLFQDSNIKPIDTSITKIQMYLYQNNRVAHDLLIKCGIFSMFPKMKVLSQL